MYSLSDYDFHLPEELIATRPAVPRRASRLLYSHKGTISDQQFAQLPDLLRPNDLLILNNTKVLNARLKGHRERHSSQGVTSAKIEIMLDRATPQGHWFALAKPLKKLNIGDVITFSPSFHATVLDKIGGQVELSFNCKDEDLDDCLAQHGEIPLPPYIASMRAADDQDATDYQTVFAKHAGAVAAPTASLHFDDHVLERLSEKGVRCAEVTLHVGAGTFLPVKVDDIKTHRMHPEWGEVSQDTADRIAETKASGGRVIAVGTTALRLIETASRTGTIAAWQGETDIFIYPGFEFHAADALITNFHLPQSTLLMLVSAFVGFDQTKAIYEHAIAQKYRFFSYGDSSLLIP